jgi:hypothetical protein
MEPAVPENGVCVCAWCRRKVRGASGRWYSVSQLPADLPLTHGICTECRERKREEYHHAESKEPTSR